MSTFGRVKHARRAVVGLLVLVGACGVGGVEVAGVEATDAIDESDLADEIGSVGETDAGEIGADTAGGGDFEPEPATPTTSATTTTSTLRMRQVYELGYVTFATAGDVVLVLPADRLELIGFHESNHDGAQQMTPTALDSGTNTMESRERDTGSRTSADIAIDPSAQIRAPVTGTVIRSGTYVLYCDNTDEFVVIEPDTAPGWQVKILHITGVAVSTGERVDAGITVIADHATTLPFPSQIDELTAEPSWPHTHIEVVDPTVSDRPGPGC